MNIKPLYTLRAVRLLTALFIVLQAGCRENKNSDPITEEEKPDVYSYELLKEYNREEMKKIESSFLKQFIGLSSDVTAMVENSATYGEDVQMRVYKVKLETSHTDGSGKRINLSGVLIAPPAETGRKYRRIIAPPYTYVMKDDAPTARIAGDRLDAHLIFWITMAFEHGFAVMMPDYPGFGDSYGQCYIPYVEKAPMTRTAIAFMEATMSALEAEKYEYKDGYVIAGYSLGAYVALQVARELETAAAYSSREDMKVDLLIAGGSPCNLLEIASLARAAQTLPQPYLLPLALLGYKNNGYKHLSMTDYLREPYASGVAVRLDGTHDDYERFFPQTAAELFTEAFIANENMSGINQILAGNSVEAWTNSCRFIMTHGKADVTVYYAQAQRFATAQAQNGSVSFVATEGTHTSAAVWFFLRLYLELQR